ncbi:MAG: TMAO reductase system periplasmic protein TorT, partial [Pseudomonadales bacterium]|nr:TMAO reductase system periplasmic protein TorT [Pseudomonadales bacterium]
MPLLIKPLLLSALLCLSLSARADWQPLDIVEWTPAFSESAQRKTISYKALDKADKAWKICVSIPNLKDSYWLAVNYALVDQAKRLGLSMRIDEAGGYNNLAVQRQQIKECMDSGADGLIVSGISNGLNDLVAHYTKQGNPVIDLINSISAAEKTARV